MKLTEQSSNTLNYLKCILCIAVVFIHARYFPDLSLLGIQNIADYGVYNAIEIILLNGFTTVPLKMQMDKNFIHTNSNELKMREGILPFFICSLMFHFKSVYFK